MSAKGSINPPPIDSSLTVRKPRRRTLAESLAELERTNPAVAKASREVDRVAAEILGRAKLEAFVSVDPDGRAAPILCARKVDAEYQNTRTRSGKGITVVLVERDPDAEAALRLLKRFHAGKLSSDGLLLEADHIVHRLERRRRK